MVKLLMGFVVYDELMGTLPIHKQDSPIIYLVANYPRRVKVGYNPSDLHGISRVNPLITGVN